MEIQTWIILKYPPYHVFLCKIWPKMDIRKICSHSNLTEHKNNSAYIKVPENAFSDYFSLLMNN